ncbi:MAG: phosphoenolpyruvate--protein phosphotransferase [Synergistaceae bacterium]|jgi:phosphotransferase system enzyme I (PtsI)|nr:phosphoenolpyruvate--protein phosphotransferase [Synergistaceae bacterium]
MDGEEKRFQGVPISAGVAIAPVRRIVSSPFLPRGGEARSAADELALFERAFQAVIDRLGEMEKESERSIGKEKASIFGAHAMMLADPMFKGGVTELIRNGRWACDAIYEKTMEIRGLFSSLPDPYLRERAADVDDIGRRLFREVKGEGDLDLNAPGRYILVTDEIAPSEAATLSPERVAGLITRAGGATSHYAIILSALEIPAVSGIDGGIFRDGANAVCDGQKGMAVLDPVPATVGHYERKLSAFFKEKEGLKDLRDKAAMTKDGLPVELWGNIASPDEAAGVLSQGGTGVGLFRTEYLFMNRDAPPSEEEQYLAYKSALENMKDRPAVIRTLDAGGDKQVPYLAELVGSEANPFLGLRAIRLCLQNEPLFSTQLRALLRASSHGDLRIMLPMISDVSQIRQVRERLEKSRLSLAEEGVVTRPYRLGIMIEIPSAAIMSSELAREADFFSVGTNDLVQYTLAVDRLNSMVSSLYEPWHPAVLRLLKMTAESASAAGIELGVCGEMAGDPLMLPVFIGFGFRELSMSPAKLPWIKSRLSRMTEAWAKDVAFSAAACAGASEARHVLETSAEELMAY